MVNSGILLMFRILWDQCVLIMDLVLSDGSAVQMILPILQMTDNIAIEILEHLLKDSPDEIKQQMSDNIQLDKGSRQK